MFELFLNPANLIAGGILVSAPILIHLLNRMRYRRTRWAAMEFLLKSQKRNRRRLIIEQLLLLAMRVALVLLIGLLLARFLGFSWAGFRPRDSLHVVILDDRLSMSDHWRTPEGEDMTCFRAGTQVLERELAKLVAQTRTPQRLVLMRLSEPGVPVDVRLNEDSLKEVTAALARMGKPTLRHLDLARGVDAAREIFAHHPEDDRFLHLISDFRERQWLDVDGNDLLKKLQLLAKDVKIHLVDTAHPVRTDTQPVPLYHDNLAIVELRPETRVTAEGMLVQFVVTVANYSPSERKNVRVTVKVNGTERLEGSVPLASVLPGQTSGSFQIAFNQLGFNEVSANLEDEEAGIQADNIRYAVIEVRRQVPVLLIDGDLTNGDKPGGDSYHLRTLLTSARGYGVVRAGPTELERSNLEQYPSIYLLNVRELTDRALHNLEHYAREGGGVAFFLGDRINPDYYTKRLYAGGKGIFPAPLADRPSPALTEEQKQEKQIQNLADARMQILLRRPDHPILAEVARFRDLFKYLAIDRYYPVLRQKWDRELNGVEELVSLPNDRPVADYQMTAEEMMDHLPIQDARYRKYRNALEHAREGVRAAMVGKPLYQLAQALGVLLNQSSEPQSDGALLSEFWRQNDPKVQELKTRFESFLQQVQFGDPLVLASRYGKGRVAAFLTSAGKSWNDWAGGGPASVTYPLVMLDLQRYLTGVDRAENQMVGQPIEVDTDSSRYDTKVHCSLRHSETSNAGTHSEEPGAAKDTGVKDLGELLGVVNGNRLRFHFDQTAQPGVYQFELTPRAELGNESRKEMRAFAFNVDTTHESDLRRASRAELQRIGQLSTVNSGSFLDLMERPEDLSESPWFYLVLLLLLIAEQALAVHLSFHLRSNEAPLASTARNFRATAA